MGHFYAIEAPSVTPANVVASGDVIPAKVKIYAKHE